MSRYKNALGLGALILIVIAVFAPLMDAPKLDWDDDSNIFANPYFHAKMWWAFWSEPYFGLYVPVSYTLWGFVYKMGGGAVAPFRVFNLLLHIANVSLVYRLMKALGERWQLKPAAIWVGVVLFALHPMQVHAVAWISGGRDLMATFFGLSAIAVYYKRDDVSWFSFASLCFMFATLCKPSAVILPFVILLMDFLLNGKIAQKAWIKMGAWVFFGVAVTWLTRSAQAEFTGQVLTLGERVLVVLDTYNFYLQKIFYPIPLSGNYARTPDVAINDPGLWLGIISVVGVLGGLVVLAWKADRRYATIALWMVALAPVSGLVNFGFQKISTVSDHYAYFPMTAFGVFVAFVLTRITWVARKEAYALPVLAALLFAFLSSERTKAWENDEAFFTDMIRTAPDSYSTAMGMSVVECEVKKNYEEGVMWTHKALAARPLDILAMANQAYCFLHARNYFRVIELEAYLGQMDLDYLETKQPTAYSSLLASIGTAYVEQNDYDDGFQFLCEAYRVKPSEPNHLKNLQIAAQILKENGLNPDCEEPAPEDEEFMDAPDDGPLIDVWPGDPEEEAPETR